MINSTEQQNSTSRRGALFVIVIVCLVLSGGLVLNLTQRTLHHYRQSRENFEYRQLKLLAEDSLRAAVRKANKAETYAGESWEIPAENWPLSVSGKVTTSIEKQSQLRVVAELQRAGETTARITKTTLLNTQNPGVSEP